MAQPRRTSLTLALALLLMGAGQALAQWAPERPVVLRGKVVSMHKKVRQGQVVIRQGKVVAILP